LKQRIGLELYDCMEGPDIDVKFKKIKIKFKSSQKFEKKVRKS